MTTDQDLRSRYATLDNDALIEFRERPGLTPEALQVLDELIGERNLEPGQIAAAKRHFREEQDAVTSVDLPMVKRHWNRMVFSLVVPIIIGLIISLMSMGGFLLQKDAWMLAGGFVYVCGAISFLIYLIKTARGVHSSVFVLYLAYILPSLIGFAPVGAILVLVILRSKINAAAPSASDTNAAAAITS